jgi:beta-1,4-N-acetylglucosaminyltransferase
VYESALVFAMDAEKAWPGGSPGLPTDVPPTWTTIFTPITSLSPMSRLLLLFLVFNFILINFCFFRLASVLNRDPICRRPPPSPETPSRLLIVLGSGGHTAEMLNILGQYQRLQLDWTHRTYVVSSGDGFSASKAKEFEAEMSSNLKNPTDTGSYDIVEVHRARRVHQPLHTTVISSLQCLWDCIKLLRGIHPDSQASPKNNTPNTTPYPDLILTNGPGTGVIVILASILLLFLGFTGPSASLPRSKKVMKHASTLSSPSTASTSKTPLSIPTTTEDDTASKSGQMRSIYIESWARVKTLSLSGKLLKPLVDRFLVQWPQLVEKEGSGGKVEFVGTLVA